MKRLLLDQGLPRSASALLAQASWDVIHVSDIGMSRADDTVNSEQRCAYRGCRSDQICAAMRVSKEGGTSMVDRTTKVILVVIALGLWGNMLLPILRTTPARADPDGYLIAMAHDIHGLWSGTCINSRLC